MSAIQHCTQLKAYYQPVRRCGKVKEGKNKIGPPMRLVLNNVASAIRSEQVGAAYFCPGG